MKLYVKSEKCIACGRCYLNYPDVFDSNDEGIAYVKKDSSQQAQEASMTAIYECPTRAIEKEHS